MDSAASRTLYALRTATGAVCAETALCSAHRDFESEGYAREMGSQSDDVVSDGPFVAVAQEEMDDNLACIICGWPE